MKDEEEGLIDVPLSNKSDIHIFYVIPLRFPTKFELSLFNWKKLLIVTWGIQTMFFMALSGLMKPSWDAFTKSMIVIAVVSPFFGYLMVLLNMFNGGWGREESRFWCHIRIMYLEGYNSMRWIIASIIDPAMVIANCTIQGEDIPSAFWSGISVVYCYYILSSIEFNKRQPIEWDKYKNDFDKLNELMVLCGGIKYGDGYSIDELYKDVFCEVLNVQNYWLAEEYPYQVDKGLVKDIGYEFIGY